MFSKRKWKKERKPLTACKLTVTIFHAFEERYKKKEPISNAVSWFQAISQFTTKMTLVNALRHPIDTYVAFKENFRRRTPVEKWQYVLNIARTFRWIGIYILEAKNKIDLRTIITGFTIVNYYVCLFYTFYLYRSNVMRAVLPLSTIGIALPVRPKMILLTYRRIYRFLFLLFAFSIRAPSITRIYLFLHGPISFKV